MNKNLFIILAVALVAVVSVSAWHCSDSDQNRPNWNPQINGYGPWGDNGLLNGTTWGWFNSDVHVLPSGCSGSLTNADCQDFCDGTTLTEFYCSDRPATNESYQSCHWEGSGRNRHKVCVTAWHMVSHPTETVIFLKHYENSTECNQVPEFGFVAGMVAITGAVAGVVILRKKK